MIFNLNCLVINNKYIEINIIEITNSLLFINLIQKDSCFVLNGTTMNNFMKYLLLNNILFENEHKLNHCPLTLLELFRSVYFKRNFYIL